MVYQERIYREQVKVENLIKFEVIEKESNLLISAETNLFDKALASLLKYRGQLERYIAANLRFLKTFSPERVFFPAPTIVKEMAWAARQAHVGPMAAVAGTLAEFVGRDLLAFSPEVVVENGSDIFLKLKQTCKVGIFAGNSLFSGKIALELEPRAEPYGICTTSGTAGNAFSFGKADAVVVVGRKASLADAAATAIGNVVKEISDIDQGLKLAKKIKGLEGVLIVKDDELGALGKLKLVPF